jgi:hypothetical protein
MSNSPYNLSGPFAVNQGAVLTVEAGAIVNLNNYFIEVNGTLKAEGTVQDNIHFNGGRVLFMADSPAWNNQTGSGSKIENSVLTSVIEIYATSPKIANNTINSYIDNSPINDRNAGSPIISNNIINSGHSLGIRTGRQGSPIISQNIITIEATDGYAIWAEGSPLITNNALTGGTQCTGIYIVGNGNATVSDNSVQGFRTGISFSPSFSKVERNLIIHNDIGIRAESEIGVIRNNTIAYNNIGVQTYNSPNLIYNNIQDNFQNSIYSYYDSAINASYNWWGTLDRQTINQTIYDAKNNFNRGPVIFVPFLSSPNPQAPAVQQTPTNSPSQSEIAAVSPSPSIPELSPIEGLLVISLIVTTLTSVLFVRGKKRSADK